MDLLLVGLSHRTAPLEVRERVAFDAASLPVALERLAGMGGRIQEVMLLSTCNRTEVILRAGDLSAAAESVTRFLQVRSGLSRGDLDEVLYRLRDLDAVQHLFRVSSSLESMMIGEPQIAHQVKEAHARALEEGRLGAVLDGLCRRALSTAKRVRRETRIGENPVSISYAASELARTIFGSLAGRKILVMGAGKMSELAVRHLMAAGATGVNVTTRRYHRAVDLASRVGGDALPFDRKQRALEEVDVVISSTAAPHVILTRDDVAELIRKRRNRPIFFIDIAVPRDIDPAANDIDNVYLYDIDDLQRVVDSNLDERRQEAVRAEAIIAREVESFHRWYVSLAAGPTINSLREALHGLKDRELERFRSRCRGLSADQEAAVAGFARALVNKILHRPITELRRSLDGRSVPGQIEVVRRLFGLDDEEPDERGDDSPVAGRHRSGAGPDGGTKARARKIGFEKSMDIDGQLSPDRRRRAGS